MQNFICMTCGVQHAEGETEGPPEHCLICEDERQYIGHQGQRWTTIPEMQTEYFNRIEEIEPGLTGVGTVPGFAIGQRALLVQTPRGNVLWDCISLLDRETEEAVRRLGGLNVILAATVGSTNPVNGGTVSDNQGNGIHVDYGSDGTISNVEIFNNFTGIMVSTGHATLDGGNNVHHNRQHGVVAQAGAVLGLNGSKVTQNAQIGVLGYLGATIVMNSNEISSNGESGVFCLNDCTLQVTSDRITGNAHHGIGVQRRSTLIDLGPIDEPTDASGNTWVDLWCGVPSFLYINTAKSQKFQPFTISSAEVGMRPAKQRPMLGAR